MRALRGFARLGCASSEIFADSGLLLRAYLLLLTVPNAGSVSWLLPRTIRTGALAAPARSVERWKPSENAWRRLLTERGSRPKQVRHSFAIQRLPSGLARYPYNYCYYLRALPMGVSGGRIGRRSAS